MATGSISTLGIGSTLDLQGIIDGLREADEVTITQMENEVTELEATQDEFNVINAKLLDMKSSALSLSLSSNWLGRTSSVSSEVISATVADGTETGSYAVEVERLASESSYISSGFESSSSSIYVPTVQTSGTSFAATTDTILAENEKMVITFGEGDDQQTISVTGGVGGYSLDDLVTAINTDSENTDGSGGTVITATTVEDTENGVHYFQISATSGGSGEDNRVEVTTEPAATSFAASDATFAYQVGDTEVSLTISVDTKLSELVDQINDDSNNPGVTASLVDTGIGTSPYKLVLTADSSGEDNRIYINSEPADLSMTEQNGSGYVMESETAIDPSSLIIITQSDGNTDFLFQENTGDGYSSEITATIADGVYTKGDDLAAAVEKAMEEASSANGSGIDYTVNWNSTTSKLEITEAGTLTNLNIKWSDARSTAASKLGFTNDIAITPSASSLNAAVKVDGVSFQRQANSGLTDLVTGITLTLADTGSSTITVDQETESLEEDITALVTMFSEIATEIDSNDDYDEDTDTWGSLAKSSSIQTFESGLLDYLGMEIDNGGSITSLYDLGFEIDENGNITIDADTLSEALSSNFDDLKTFILGTDDDDGLAGTLNDYLREQTIGGGYIDSETSGIDDKISALEDSIESQQEIIDSRYETMTATFVELDQYMRQMESMSNYVSQVFSASDSSSEDN